MRVVQVTGFGGPDVLVAGEAPDATAGVGEVVIAVAVAAIEPVDTRQRRGALPRPELPAVPYVPGHAVAGEVIAAGTWVDRGWVGRLVAASAVSGGYAQQAVAAAQSLFPVPDGLGLPEAAALLGDGITALGLFEGGRVRRGDWVLVEDAGDGVGCLLVQLAYAAGARVIAATRGERKLRLVRELGAECAVDAGAADWREQVRTVTGGAEPDVVFDAVGTRTDRSPFARDRAVRVLAEAAVGRLRAVIGQTFPLERAADAHAAIEAGDVTGTSLLLV